MYNDLQFKRIKKYQKMSTSQSLGWQVLVLALVIHALTIKLKPTE